MNIIEDSTQAVRNLPEELSRHVRPHRSTYQSLMNASRTCSRSAMSKPAKETWSVCNRHVEFWSLVNLNFIGKICQYLSMTPFRRDGGRLTNFEHLQSACRTLRSIEADTTKVVSDRQRWTIFYCLSTSVPRSTPLIIGFLSPAHEVLGFSVTVCNWLPFKPPSPREAAARRPFRAALTFRRTRCPIHYYFRFSRLSSATWSTTLVFYHQCADDTQPYTNINLRSSDRLQACLLALTNWQLKNDLLSAIA